MTTAQHATLVPGMHRSGTSLVTGLLVRCGLRPPRTLMPPGADNVEGYWESSLLHDFHEDLLEKLSTRWNSYTRIAPDWMQTELGATARADAHRLLGEEFGTGAPFVLKDPRLCRLLPFWLEVLSAGGLSPSIVLVLRHPHQVAASLAARDGLCRRRSLLIWLRHVLDAEAGTRGLRRCVLLYEDVLADWRAAVHRMARVVPLQETAAVDTDDIVRFVRPDLHHQRMASEGDIPPTLADWLEATWGAMTALVHDDASRAHLRALDSVRADFDRSVELFGVDAEQEALTSNRQNSVLEQQAAGTHRQLVNLHAANDRLTNRITQLEAERLAFDARAQALEAEMAALRAQLVSASGQLAAQAAECARLQAAAVETDRRTAALSAQLTSLEKERAALYASKSWRLTAPLRAFHRAIGLS